jgi:hypothetical protein
MAQVAFWSSAAETVPNAEGCGAITQKQDAKIADGSLRAFVSQQTLLAIPVIIRVSIPRDRKISSRSVLWNAPNRGLSRRMSRTSTHELLVKRGRFRVQSRFRAKQNGEWFSLPDEYKRSGSHILDCASVLAETVADGNRVLRDRITTELVRQMDHIMEIELRLNKNRVRDVEL